MNDPVNTRQKVGEAVTQRLKQLGMTQQELAQASGVSTSTIRKLQHGAPVMRPDRLAKISRGLRWPADALSTMLAGGATPNRTRIYGDGPAGTVEDLGREISRLTSKVDELRGMVLTLVERDTARDGTSVTPAGDRSRTGDR